MSSLPLLNEDFTRRQKLTDLGRWYVTNFVQRVAGELPAKSRVLDAGAGECAYKRFFEHCRYSAVDLGVGDDGWNYTNLNTFGALHDLPYRNDSFDAILCTQVLEHLSRPAESLVELYRVLKPGGRLYLTAPMAHPEHQVPYDFFRYTSYGLRHLLNAAGFAAPHIEPFGGMCIRWAYEAPRLMAIFPGTGLQSGRPSLKGIAALPLRFLSSVGVKVAQSVLVYLDRYDSAKDDPFGWSVIAEK